MLSEGSNAWLDSFLERANTLVSLVNSSRPILPGQRVGDSRESSIRIGIEKVRGALEDLVERLDHGEA